MKKVSKKTVKPTNDGFYNENDEIFDPDDNLYNNPDRDEGLTFDAKNNCRSNISGFSKKTQNRQ